MIGFEKLSAKGHTSGEVRGLTFDVYNKHREDAENSAESRFTLTVLIWVYG
jgi:hypothetical protein